MTTGAKTVTILFTDLVGSTELLQRAGDEQAQRIFKAHHRLLREAVESHGGHEVKWLGDGLMVAFDSAQEAVKCAIAMQQSSRRPAAGERLEIRAGLNVGEALLDESDYFGTPVVVARRLCDRAGSGQIFASDIVVRVLDGRGADLDVTDLGPLELKGITNAVPAVEIVYQHDPMALLRKLPFVGRQVEYETLLKKLAEASNRRGSVVLLAGEPGIGKTRLTEEFCEHASSGATVIRGNSYEGDVAAPFGPWTETLRSLTEQLADAALRDALGPGAPEIATMLPELRRRIPDIEEAPRLDPESERARLFDSVGAFLRNAAEQRPLVIFLDDLHWCDKPSLALLEVIARGIADRRIVIVGTYRDMEVDRVHPLAQTLAALRRMEHHERMAIHGLPREEVDDLLTSIEPSEESRPVRRVLSAVLSRETEGNPLFIWEVITHLIEAGKIVHEGGHWTSHITDVADLGIPEGVREVVGRRLSRLGENCNRMLQRASAMTSGFTWEELCAICDESEDELLDSLDEALGSQLIAERSRGVYAFTHALIRATLYEELSTPRRVMLHRRVAEALETLYENDIEPHLGELASHYLASMGGDAQKAIEYSVRAGDRAREMFAWEEAAAHYQRALEAMSLAGTSEDDQRCELLLSLANCQNFSAQYDESIDLMREAAEIARAIPSATLLARTALSFEDAAQKLPADRTAERITLHDEALNLLGSEDSRLRPLVLANRVQAAAAAANSRDGISPVGFIAWAGFKEDAILSQAREAVALAESLDDDLALATTAYYLHNYSWGPDNVKERFDLATRAFEAAKRAGDGRRQIELAQLCAGAFLELGDVSTFRERLAEYVALTDRVRYRGDYHVGPASHAMLETAEGKLSLAQQHMQEYAAAETGNPTAAVTYVGQLFGIRQMQGRLSELEEMWQGVVAQWPGLASMQAALSLIYASSGNAGEAQSVLQRLARDELGGIPRDFLWELTMAAMGEACADVDELPAGQLVYEAFLPYKLTNISVAVMLTGGSAARVLGRLAVMLERLDEAEQHFETALEDNHRWGFHAWTSWTRLNYGDMLLRRGRPEDRERAVALLEEALSFAREAGMAKVQADSERLLAGQDLQR